MVIAEGIARLFEEKKNKIESEISRLNKVFQVKFEDMPGQNFYIKISSGSVEVRRGEHPNPNITFSATVDTFVRVVSGELYGPTAVLSGKLKVEGSVIDALILYNILQKLQSED